MIGFLKKHKILSGFLIFICIVIITFSVFSISVRVGIPKERHYVSYIKGIWEPWPPIELAQDMERVKEDNINLVSFGPLVIYPAVQFFYEPLMFNLMKQAKKNGLAVHIAPQAFGPGGAEPGNVDEKDIEKYTEKVIGWAKISEKYGVEYFSPMTEADYVLGPDRAVEWHKEVLPEIREVYSGKVIAKWTPRCGCVTDMDIGLLDCVAAEHEFGYNWTIATLQRVVASKDYDGVMLDVFPPDNIEELETFHEWFEDSVKKTSSEAKKYNIPIYIGEFATATEKPKFLEKIMGGPLVSKEEQAEFTARYLDAVMPYYDGVIYCGWSLPGYGVKDKPVEQVIKNRFGIKDIRCELPEILNPEDIASRIPVRTNLVFEENFEGKGWETRNADYAYSIDKKFGDAYRMIVKFKIVEGTAMVFFEDERQTNPLKTFYVCQIAEAGRLLFMRQESPTGGPSEPDRTMVAEPRIEMKPNVWNNLEISRNKNYFAIYLNDRLVHAFSDPNPLKGSFELSSALYSHLNSNNHVVYSQIKVFK